jgi:small subunit ribosomal protein S1
MEMDALATPESAEITGIKDIKRKMHFTGTVTKTTLAGAVVDIGLDTPGVVHISQLQKEPVNKVEDVVQEGQTVDVWVRRVDLNKGRIELTMNEPLALEWRELKKDMVVTGKVVRLEKFGVFVDIGAERPGLVHISEITHDYIRNPGEVLKEGEEVEVKILAVDRRRKKIKLSMKALEEKPAKVAKAAQKEKTPAGAAAEKEEPVPTAMEMALREAMERAKTKEEEEAESKRKPASTNKEMENILSRTLENRAKTSSR